MKFAVIKQNYPKFESDNPFRIFKCQLCDFDPSFQTKYGYFSLKGNLPFMSVGQEYDYQLALVDENQYGFTYEVQQDFSLNVDEMSEELQRQILESVTSSKDIVESIMSVYPNYVKLVISGQQDDIDISLIHNVGAYRHGIYCEKIINNYKVFSMQSELSHWDLTIDEVRELFLRFNLTEEINHQFVEHPYETYCGILDREFEDIDMFVIKDMPQHKVSFERCEWCVIDVLRLNEIELKNTRMNANDMVQYVPKELRHILVETVLKSDRIYYDKESKWVSLESTYHAEKRIADKLKAILSNSNNLGFETEKYKGDLTDEQFSVLDVVNKSSACILTGSGGCVDGDTEFFNGFGWKKIRDYENGDKVLQYNLDGSATLVEPEKYWQVPCEKLYHFETKYGLSQTVCDEHDIVYKTPKGVLKHTNIAEIIKKQNTLDGGFTGRFMTTFNYSGDGIDLTDDEIRLMVAVIADGSFQKQNKDSVRCRFHIKKEAKKDRLRMLIKRVGCDCREHESTAEGYTDFHVTVPRREKVFTSYWYGCNHHQLEVFCDEVMRWDGTTNVSPIGKVTRQRFSTTIKKSADFVQFAFSSIGKRATIKVNDRRGRVRVVNGKEYVTNSIEYTVLVTDRNMVGMCCDTRDNNKKTMVTTRYTNDGYKYCFTVPSHMLVLRNNNCVFITGNCGKSFTTKAIVDMLLDNDMSVRLVAPTGIASKVSSRYTGLQATTIHSACLSCKYDFLEDVIIVDEASMVSIETMDMLCQHLNEYHRVIFVADRRQLPSITAGNVFSDIVDSGLLPCVTLTKVFRFNSSGIAQVTTNTRNNIKRNVAERQFDDYDFITLSSDPLEQIDEVYTKCLEKYQPDDILILSPYNKQSCGTRAINNYIQSIHNPSDVELGYKVDGTNVMFHVGDLVINTKNNYQAVSEKRWEYNERVKFLMESGKLPTDFEPEHFDDVFIANGDIGTVAWIKGDTLCVMFKDENIIYEKSELKNLLLAYAISIHKSQGCEAKCVIVIESKQHRNLSRNAIYVATSRAKEYLCEIGDEQKINDAMEQDEAEIRCTWLKDLLQKS